MFAGGSLIGGLAQNTVGSVGSLEISRQEYSNIYQQISENYRTTYNLEAIPPSLASQISVEAQQRIVSEYLMRAAILEKNIYASDSAVAARIREFEDFQDEGGNFSKELYDEYVSDSLFFQKEVRRSLNQEFLLTAMKPFSAKTIRARLAAFRQQKRVIDETTISVTETFDIKDEDIAEYYKINQSDYTLQEEADFEYVALFLEDFISDIVVDEDTVKEAYQGYVAEADDSERRHVRHIYIAGENEAAQQKALDIAKRANNEDFATLAKEMSEDPGSALSGGDLGFISYGDLPSEMEVAVFKLEARQISEPIAVDGGFSVLKLEDIIRASRAPLAEIRPEIEKRAKIEQGRDSFEKKVNELADIAHVEIGSLLSVAIAADVSLQQVTNVASQTPKANPLFFQNEELLTELFSSTIVNDGENSTAIAVDENTYVFARSTRYQAPRNKHIAEVQEEIEQILSAQESIKTWREDKLPFVAEWENLRTVSLIDDDETAASEGKIVDEIFTADLRNGLPAYTMLPKPEQVDVFRIHKVINNKPNEDDFSAIDEIFSPLQESLAGIGYLESLENRYNVDFEKQPEQ